MENVVAQRDLFAFACEDKGDMSDLINELCVKQKLGVNVIYCAPSDRLVYSPKTPIDDLRYALVNCPILVQYLVLNTFTALSDFGHTSWILSRDQYH